MNKAKLIKEQRAVSPATTKSIKALIQYAFADMLRLLSDNQQLVARETTVDEIKSYKHQATMFTVSSSHFRMVVLLHYPAHTALSDQQLKHFAPELRKNIKQYHDYVCELGNNLCGVVCRVLGAEGLSTGMSTPALLNIMNSAGHLGQISPYLSAHMTSFATGSPLLSTTFSLFFNGHASTDLVINVPSGEVQDTSLGELEFF